MLELYINNQLADLKEETIIAVTKTYESLVNPTLYYADFSKTVTLPVSPRNNAIFNNFNRLDSTVTNVGIDPSKKIPYIVLNNKEAVLQGYLHLDNTNTVWTDEVYQVTLYSTLGFIFNEMKLLTFNKNVSDLDPKYIIESPLSDDLVIDRNLVKSSFEQQMHTLDSDLITDWIGFIPTYQGFYSNFSSDKEQIFPEGRVDEMPTQRDEHYRREFRSYYQQPFIWVDKLWKCAKDSIERITDYTLRLDRSWFNQSNPYYRDLIYTCPNLFTSDSNFKSLNGRFQNQLNVEMFEKGERTQVPLSTPTNVWLQHLTPNETTDLYNDGVFNPNGDMGGTQFKGKLRTVICAAPPQDGGQFAKIKKSNPFIVTVKAVRASDDTEIQGARKKFLLYSCGHNISSNAYDEAIDLSISNRSDADVSVPVTQRPLLAEQGYHETGDGYWWEVMLEFTLNVTENTPYKVVVSVGNFNNDEPFEFSSGVFGSSSLIPKWDWLWVDFFSTGLQAESGYDVYFDAFDCEVSTQENLRSFSNVSLYRIFPKDTTICDVILNYSKTFGLVWTVDETAKEVSVMTRNKFYNDYRIVDWTDKIDRSNDFVFNPLNFDKRYVTFNFDEGKCGRLERYEDMYNYTYGSKKLDTGYEFNSDENKLFEKMTPSVIAQKRQYSRMYNTTNPNAANFMGYSYMVYPEEHYVDNDKEGSNAGMSGAFYFRNGTFDPDSRLSLPPSDSRYYIILTDDTTHQIQTGDYCWNVCGENMTLCYKLPDISTISKDYGGKRYSVHFEAPKEYFFDPAIYGNADIKYIYANYWQDYINERYCTQNKKLTAYIYITPDEFADIDFREFVKIDNILYHIDKVYDYDFNANNPVKMDLVQVWNLSAYTDGQGDFPYLFTEEESVIATTTAQTLTVYASGNWTVAGGVFQSDWISASKVDGGLQISATSDTGTYREGTVALQSLASGMVNPLWWILEVVQYPSTQHRLDTELHTVVFDGDGGTDRVSVDCSNLLNNAITVTTNKSWLTASIQEYSQSIDSVGRLNLHLDITAQPNTFIMPRNGVVTLSATLGGMPYTTIVNIGQQGSETHPRIFNTDIITHEYALEEGLSVLDESNTPVNTLISGTTYHFTDLFPEEIDINSLAITNGTVNITGNAGEQVVTFTPQLVNGNEVGGGVITAKTLDGKDLCYNYDLYLSEPQPVVYNRVVSIKATDGGLFRITINGNVIKSTDYWQERVIDGTDIKLMALPKDGYAFSLWKDSRGNEYTTSTINFTVDQSLEDEDGNIIYYPYFKEGVEMVTVAFNAGTYGGQTQPYLTIGTDSTRYTTVRKTVPKGTVIGSVEAHGTETFRQWSDGSTTNPRDYIANTNTTVTALYTTATAFDITADGSGLSGVNDSVLVNVNGTRRMTVRKDLVDSIPLTDGTYTITAECRIADNNSKFNTFVVDNVASTSNPYTFTTNTSKKIQVTTIPSALYYTEDTGVNYFEELKPRQDWLLDSVFRIMPIEKEVWVPVEVEYGEITLAIPTDYNIVRIANGDGGDIMGEFRIEKSDNGEWWRLYSRHQRLHRILFALELA